MAEKFPQPAEGIESERLEQIADLLSSGWTVEAFNESVDGLFRTVLVQGVGRKIVDLESPLPEAHADESTPFELALLKAIEELKK